MSKIFVAPRGWTKIAHNLFVFFNGHCNTWVEYSPAGSIRFGATGLWAIHKGPVVSLPKSWDQVTEKRTVTQIDFITE